MPFKEFTGPLIGPKWIKISQNKGFVGSCGRVDDIKSLTMSACSKNHQIIIIDIWKDKDNSNFEPFKGQGPNYRSLKRDIFLWKWSQNYKMVFTAMRPILNNESNLE